jgi:hypothetical protein
MHRKSFVQKPGISEACGGSPLNAFRSETLLEGECTKLSSNSPCSLAEPQILQAFVVASRILMSGKLHSMAVKPGSKLKTSQQTPWQYTASGIDGALLSAGLNAPELLTGHCNLLSSPLMLLSADVLDAMLSAVALLGSAMPGRLSEEAEEVGADASAAAASARCCSSALLS